MRTTTILGATCAAAVLASTVLTGQGTASAATAPSTARTSVVSAPNEIRVGSYNVSSVTFDTSATATQRPWRERRDRVASQITAEGLDVVGIQEANPSPTYASRLVRGVNQFDDLKNALNEQGGHWALTNAIPYNCANGNSTYKCVYQYRGASNDTRILYNTDKLSVVHRGSYKFRAQTAGKYDRYLAWAVLRVKATGKEFVFTSTHLDPYTTSSRVAEWKEAIAKTLSLKGTWPIVAVGDYSTTNYSTWAKEMLPYTKSKGFGDVLGQEYQVNPVRVKRAASTTNAWMNSFNGYRRDGRTFCYCDRKDKYGNNIDWIFASNNLKVKDWEGVLDMNWSSMLLNSVIPSDHNLIRSTLVLP